MSNVNFPAKFQAETKVLTFPFLSDLPTGVTISSAVVTVLDSTGTDPTPANVKSGTATVAGYEVKQKVTGGVAGVVYSLNCAATLSDGQVLLQRGSLAIIPAA